MSPKATPSDEFDPGNGSVVSLAQELRRLRVEAGNPSFRTMQQAANYSYAALSRVASGKGRIPSWPAVEAFVRACGGRPEDWRRRWEAARDAAATPLVAAPVGSGDRLPLRPVAVSTPVAFVERLRDLKDASDVPSYREIGELAGLPTSTVADIFNTSRARVPPWEAVSRVLTALGVADEARDEWQEAWRQLAVQSPQRHPESGATQQLLRQALDLGLEGIYPTRAEALKVFADAIDREIEQAVRSGNLPDADKGRVWVFGSSHKGLIQIAIGRFDGSELIERVVKAGCDLRLLCTNPANATMREGQENRVEGEIEKEIRLSLSHFKRNGVKRENVKYHKNLPNVFAICTSDRMLLNPYPYGGEAFRDFTLIVHRTPSPDSIFEKYVRKHFEAAWRSADKIPPRDWDKA